MNNTTKTPDLKSLALGNLIDALPDGHPVRKMPAPLSVDAGWRDRSIIADHAAEALARHLDQATRDRILEELRHRERVTDHRVGEVKAALGEALAVVLRLQSDLALAWFTANNASAAVSLVFNAFEETPLPAPTSAVRVARKPKKIARA